MRSFYTSLCGHNMMVNAMLKITIMQGRYHWLLAFQCWLFKPRYYTRVYCYSCPPCCIICCRYNFRCVLKVWQKKLFSISNPVIQAIVVEFKPRKGRSNYFLTSRIIKYIETKFNGCTLTIGCVLFLWCLIRLLLYILHLWWSCKRFTFSPFK